jgi:hypothetical protein
VSADNLAKHVPAGTPGEAVCCPDGLGSIEAATKNSVCGLAQLADPRAFSAALVENVCL